MLFGLSLFACGYLILGCWTTLSTFHPQLLLKSILIPGPFLLQPRHQSIPSLTSFSNHSVSKLVHYCCWWHCRFHCVLETMFLLWGAWFIPAHLFPISQIAEVETIACIVSLGLPCAGVNHKWEVILNLV